MNATHTPGPWELEVDTVFIGDKRQVQPIAYHMDSEGIANARLIAAAPDLLAVLENLFNEFGDFEYDVAAISAARAAIAKAKGE